MFNVIAFDADDTLWHNETLYSMTQARFKQLLSTYQSDEWIEERLYETEMRNLGHYGYGIKSFTLSMIETAIELSEGRITGAEIQEIIDFAKDMLEASIRLLPDVADVIQHLADSYRLMIITKGDLFDQESKIAQSGLADYFSYVEVVTEKTAGMYRALLQKHNLDPRRFLMVGNSLRSDILPVLAVGGQAVYIPYHITWAHETVAEVDQVRDGYFSLDGISQLPALLETLSLS